VKDSNGNFTEIIQILLPQFVDIFLRVKKAKFYLFA